jgi:hypothetical protein
MKVAQHALSHNTTYKLIRTFHTGGVENGVGCQNCGKVLSNVAVVENAEGQSFQVGLDCAATLATINPFEFDAAAEAFSVGKKVRAALLKGAKTYGLKYGVSVYAINDEGTEVVVQGYRLMVTGGASHRDGIFRYYVEKDVYEAVVKPMCGELLPAASQTLAERRADEEVWAQEWQQNYIEPADRVAA